MRGRNTGTNVFNRKRTAAGTSTIRRVQARQAMQEFMHTSSQQLSKKVKEDVTSFETLDDAWEQSDYLGTQIVLLREAVLREDMQSPQVSQIRQAVAAAASEVFKPEMESDPATYLASAYFGLRSAWGLDTDENARTTEEVLKDLEGAVKSADEKHRKLALIMQVLVNTAPKDLDPAFSKAEREKALVNACNWLRTCSAKLTEATSLENPAYQNTEARNKTNQVLIEGLRSEIKNPFKGN